jgi:hypothetical protein
MTLSPEDLGIIDQRIRASQRKTEAMGTVISRDTTGPGAMVRHDGASTPTPALVPGSVFCQPGDWVTLNLYGTQWVVSNSFSSAAFGEASRFYVGLPSAAGPITSGSFNDLQEVSPITFTKLHDLTFVLISASYGGYVDAVNTEAEWAVRLVQTEGSTPYTAADISVGSIFYNTSGEHLNQTQSRRKTDIPAGTYTVSMRWRRVGGTGNLRANTDDCYTMALDERVRASTPVL